MAGKTEMCLSAKNESCVGMQKIQFYYFTGMEAEQYSFYRVPKVLFTEPCFKTLSCEAKVLYGLMLERRNRVVPTSWCRQCLHR